MHHDISPPSKWLQFSLFLLGLLALQFSLLLLRLLIETKAPLEVCLPTHNLRRIDRLHLVHPPCSRHNLPHRAHLVGCVPGDTDIVAALEDVLDVTNVELWAVAQFGEFASVGDDVVDEVVCKLEDRLHIVC